MTEPTPTNRRGRSGPRLAPLALLASGAAAAMLSIVWNDAASRNHVSQADAIRLATNALKDHGYTWARVSVRDQTVQLIGRAPDDGARVLAYHVTRRALRPLMGQKAEITTIRSYLTLRDRAPHVANGNRIAPGPSIDVAWMAPPPMPQFRLNQIETGALSTTSGLDKTTTQEVPARAAEPAAQPAETTVEEPAPISAIEAQAATHEQNAGSPVIVAANVEEPSTDSQQTAPTNIPEPPQAVTADAPTPPAPSSPALTVTLETQPAPQPPVKLAALDVPAQVPTTQTPSACAQAFNEALSGGMIQFARNSAAIEKASRPLLDKIAGIAKRCRGYSFTIEGHTDLTGSRTHNLELSRKRAEAVRWALVDRGVDMDHVRAEGYGSSRPIADGTSDAANAQNRRIAITVAADR